MYVAAMMFILSNPHSIRVQCFILKCYPFLCVICESKVLLLQILKCGKQNISTFSADSVEKGWQSYYVLRDTTLLKEKVSPWNSIILFLSWFLLQLKCLMRQSDTKSFLIKSWIFGAKITSKNIFIEEIIPWHRNNIVFIIKRSITNRFEQLLICFNSNFCNLSLI